MHRAQLGCSRGRAQPPRRQPHQDQRHRDRRRAEPVERRTASRHRRASRRSAEIAGWVSRVEADHQRRQRADRIDQQALADHLAAEREDEHEGPVGGDDLLAERKRERQQHDRPERAGQEQQRQRRERAAGAFEPRSDSRCRAARRTARAGRRGGCAPTARRCCPSAGRRRSPRGAARRPAPATAICRASHRPQAAKAKLETLPNRVALPSLVMWMPACQAARSAAKKKAANATSDRQRAARPVHRLAETARRSPTGTAAPAPAARNPAATGPTPASRTSHGPSASTQLPISSAVKANGYRLRVTRCA